MIKTLIIEDDSSTRNLLRKAALSLGHDVTVFPDARDGLRSFAKKDFSLVLLDWMLPEMSGLDFCREVRRSPKNNRCVILMITARDQPEDLQAALEAGADDYLTKPFSLPHLKVRLAIAAKRAKELNKLKEAEGHLEELRKEMEKKYRLHGIIGKSAPMRVLQKQIADLAPLNWTVLIEGETGTGKELAARAIHQSSRRDKGPFIAVNTAGLSDSLLSSQLFGHKKGSFTGASEDQKGFFEAAHGGTLFLDEIGDISPAVQSSLLRVLEEKKIIRLGEQKERAVDVRVVAATHCDLNQEVEKGRFRRDLLYRLRAARIFLPPLRDRREDIPLLAYHFLSLGRAETGKEAREFDPDFLRVLLKYSWPGNVRELRSVINFAVIHCQGPTLGVDDLPPEVTRPGPHDSPAAPLDIETALEKTGGHRGRAARLLGISRATFYRRLPPRPTPKSPKN